MTHLIVELQGGLQQQLVENQILDRKGVFKNRMSAEKIPSNTQERENPESTLMSGLSALLRSTSALRNRPMNFVGSLQPAVDRLLGSSDSKPDDLTIHNLQELKAALHYVTDLVENALPTN